MMSEELPKSYDTIIVGTGMVESILAASISRIGKKTLHIDRKNYYGQTWSTFNIEHLFEWIDDVKSANNQPNDFSKQDEEYKFDNTNIVNIVSNVSYDWCVTEEPSKEVTAPSENPVTEGDENVTTNENDSSPSSSSTSVRWTKEKVRSASRKFNLDLTPKLVLSKGPMVKLLIESEVSRYLEFFNVSNILLYLDSKIEPVPYSKSDVFSSRSVTVVEKRILMRILTQIQNDEENGFKEYEHKTFFEFLLDQKLSKKIVQQIIYCIAMVTEETPCLEGVNKAKDFLSSLGFYGNSPFLWTLYGSCDLLQAFCRLSAVYGGIYCLDRGADAIILDHDNVCKGVVSNETLLFAENVVISSHEIPFKYIKEKQEPTLKFPRAILITDRPLYKSKDKNNISFLQYPLFKDKNTVKVIELDSTTSACPQDVFIVHLIGKSSKQSYEDLELVIDNLFNSSETIDEIKPNIIFKLFFTIEDTSSIAYTEALPSHLFPCSGPDPYEIDYQSIIEEAQSIFKKMYPDEEFFGPLPPSEDEPINDESEM